MIRPWASIVIPFSDEPAPTGTVATTLPPMPKLLDAPFWLDPGDPHRMAAAMQFLTRPRAQTLAVVSLDPRYLLVQRESVWGKAVHRVAAEGITPEQAVDEAIARIKAILKE